jgi:serine/threonine-protein kinase
VQSDQKPGIVVSQDPRALTEADKGSTVDLGVSSGPGKGLIPDVKNLPRKNAIQALNDAGFRVAEDPQPSLTVPKGSAIRTSPPANRLVLKGTEVRLFVSTGPPQVQVPNVVNQDKNVATGTLKDAGFNVTQQTVTSNAPKDRVISQSPGAGATVDKGSRVTITVSKGPEQVNVPNVVDQLKGDAQATLRSAGFKVKVVTQETTAKPPDTVLRQSPPGDSKAVKGTTVTIFVAKAPLGPTGGSGP